MLLSDLFVPSKDLGIRSSHRAGRYRMSGHSIQKHSLGLWCWNCHLHVDGASATLIETAATSRFVNASWTILGFQLSDLFDQPMCTTKRQNFCAGLIARTNTCSFREEISLTPVGLACEGVFCFSLTAAIPYMEGPSDWPELLVAPAIKFSALLRVVLTLSRTLYPRCLVDRALFQQVMCTVFCHHSCSLTPSQN
jgi:hypothetical protein